MTQLFTFNQVHLDSFMLEIDNDLKLQYQKSDYKSEKYGFNFPLGEPQTLEEGRQSEPQARNQAYKWSILQQVQPPIRQTQPVVLPQQKISLAKKQQFNPFNRESVTTKASSNQGTLPTEQRFSRLSVLELFTDRSRLSNTQYLPTCLNRLSSINESLETPSVRPSDLLRTSTVSLISQEGETCFSNIQSFITTPTKEKFNVEERNRELMLQRSNKTIKEADEVEEDEYRPQLTQQSNKTERKISFKDKNDETGEPQIQWEEKKFSVTEGQDEEEKVISISQRSHRILRGFELTQQELIGNEFETAQDAEDLDEGTEQTHIPQRVYEFQQNLTKESDKGSPTPKK